jgi:hypothetical protein
MAKRPVLRGGRAAARWKTIEAAGQRQADLAKDDKTVFQYRGRFEDASQALAISYYASIRPTRADLASETAGLRPLRHEGGGLGHVRPPGSLPSRTTARAFCRRRAVRGHFRGLRLRCATRWRASSGTWSLEEGRDGPRGYPGMEAATTGRIPSTTTRRCPRRIRASAARWYDAASGGPAYEGPKETAAWSGTSSRPRRGDRLRGDGHARRRHRGAGRLGEKSATKLMRQLRLRS